MILYRASELGGCTTALVAKRLGYEGLEPPENIKQLFREGNRHEEAVIEDLEADGHRVTFKQLEVNLHITDEIVVQGHLDGIVDDGPVLEVKSMGKDEWDNFRAKEWDCPGLIQKYKWQVSSYMLATRKPLYLVAKNRNNGQMRVVVADEPFYNLNQIRARVLVVEAQVRKGELPTSCDNRIFPCPFVYLHTDEKVAELVDDEVDTLARVYKEAQREKQIAEDKVKAARRALEDGLGGKVKVVTSHGTKVTWYEVTTSKYLVDKMREDGWEVDKYKVDTVGKRLRVTVPDTSSS